MLIKIYPLVTKKQFKINSDIEYERHHRANIKIKKTQNIINIPIKNNKRVHKITVDYTHNFSGIRKSIDTILIKNKNDKSQEILQKKNGLYPNILIKNMENYISNQILSLSKII